MSSSESVYSGSDEDMPTYEDETKIVFSQFDNEDQDKNVSNRQQACKDMLSYIAYWFCSHIRFLGVDADIAKFPQYEYIISNMFSTYHSGRKPVLVYYFDTKKFRELLVNHEDGQFHEAMIVFERWGGSLWTGFKDANFSKSIFDFQDSCNHWSAEHVNLYDGLLCGDILTFSDFYNFGSLERKYIETESDSSDTGSSDTTSSDTGSSDTGSFAEELKYGYSFIHKSRKKADKIMHELFEPDDDGY
jgi:hypothetical protein